LLQVGVFLLVLPISSTNKTDRHEIAELSLKMALDTTKQTNKQTNKHHTHSIFKLGVFSNT